ncbi:MAG: sigma-70 family RNA polymerase sigma factor [Salinarimonadaceae bacterium]|nr:MAG: sigma-70 family RNA polymerase sigma factor [Salinarimonadaceae bacterium]
MSSADERKWADMMRAALSGDEKRYCEFLNEVAPVLRRLVRARASGLDAECEDILQETLLAIHLKRHTWREDEPLRPWLFSIARYKIVDAYRSRGRRVALDIEDFAETLPAPAEEDATQRGDMERVLAALDDRSAAIVRAIGLEGASVSEVGAQLSMSEGAVRVALHRGLKKLAEMRARMLE